MFSAIAWPYQLGTYIAVQGGADNPSGARTAVGWILEEPWLVFLVLTAGYTLRKYAARQHARAAHQQAVADFHALRPTNGPGSGVVYRHGGCTINHHTHDAAGRCTMG